MHVFINTLDVLLFSQKSTASRTFTILVEYRPTFTIPPPYASRTPARVPRAAQALMRHNPHSLCPAGTASGPEHARTHVPSACTHRWLCTRSRARLATPGVQGDGLWRYQHVLGEFVAVPLCSSTLLLLGVSRLARDARLDARPREA